MTETECYYTDKALSYLKGAPVDFNKRALDLNTHWSPEAVYVIHADDFTEDHLRFCLSAHNPNFFYIYSKSETLPADFTEAVFWLGRNPTSLALSMQRWLENHRVLFSLQSKIEVVTAEINKINEIGIALAAETNFDRLIGLILKHAIELTGSDGGSIYIAENEDSEGDPQDIRFKRSAMDLNANEFVMPINRNSIAGYVALTKQPLILEDVYNLPADSPFTFNSSFDKSHSYHTKSMMVVPMTNNSQVIIGVLQLVNRRRNTRTQLTLADMEGDGVIAYTSHDYQLAKALAGQAAVAVENQQLLKGQKDLLESFISLIATAIDSKSDYTGGHCARVPILTEMLAQAVCEMEDGPFAGFELSEDEWYELRIAAGLHDCGKIVTPVHVMDKATKLETIFDRIALVMARIEVLKRDATIAYLENPAGTNDEAARSEWIRRRDELAEIAEFLSEANVGGEFLSDEKIARLEEIASTETLKIGDEEVPLLSEEELYNLRVRKGTLTDEERIVINGHMVETIKMLEALPFPKNLRRVPEYAGGHHEKMDGGGYPKGIYAGDMSIPARIMAIADVFEALTAVDRPYKKGKTLSETMFIMSMMKKDNHLDTELLNLFVKSGIYKEYSRQFLPEHLIDEVNEKEILEMQPKEFELPPETERSGRWQNFLPEYR